MGSFLYEGKLDLKRINSADLASQFRRVFRPTVKKKKKKKKKKNGQDSMCVRDIWKKYKYVDSSFYYKSQLIYIKSI